MSLREVFGRDKRRISELVGMPHKSHSIRHDKRERAKRDRQGQGNHEAQKIKRRLGGRSALRPSRGVLHLVMGDRMPLAFDKR
jgi:hypothetical protein